MASARRCSRSSLRACPRTPGVRVSWSRDSSAAFKAAMVAAVTVLLVLLLRGGRREEEVMEVVEVVLRAVSIVVSIVMDGDGSDGGGAIAACRRCRSSVRRASPLIPGVLVGNPSSFNALRTVVRSIFNCKVSDSKK